MANTLRSTSRARLERCRSAHLKYDVSAEWRKMQEELKREDLSHRLRAEFRRRAENPIPQPEPETRGFNYPEPGSRPESKEEIRVTWTQLAFWSTVFWTVSLCIWWFKS